MRGRGERGEGRGEKGGERGKGRRDTMVSVCLKQKLRPYSNVYLSECDWGVGPLVVKSNESWGQVLRQLHNKVHSNKVQEL